MIERQACIDRVKGAERESYVVAAAVAHFGPVVLAGGCQTSDEGLPRDLVASADNAEPTYLIRMWAEFETALRSYRRHITADPAIAIDMARKRLNTLLHCLLIQ